MTNWKHEHDCELSLRREWSARAQKAERLLRDAIKEIERSRTALQTSLVAMRMASCLPGVSDEYDFEPAIAEVAAVMSGTKVKAREQN